MASVMIAWELGEAFGHLARCLRLGRGLVDRGHSVTLALKDVRLPAGQGLAPGITVLPTPPTAQAGPGDGPPMNYADVMRISGFADPKGLSDRLVRWQAIADWVQPDLVVADHAPTAVLMAKLCDLPHLSIGNGFVIPPDVHPWPSIRPWEAVSDQALRQAEEKLDLVLAQSQKAWGRGKPVKARDLFGANDILDTFAELDHYGPRHTGRYVGPIVSWPRALRVAWQHKEGSRILAYLRPSIPGFPSILKALARLESEVLCIAPGMTPALAKHWATRRMRIALVPLDLAPLLEHADLAIGYGNSGFSTQALMAGVPLAMRPKHVEQALFSRRVQALGAGRLLEGRMDADSVTESLHELLGNPAYRQAARAFQGRHAHYFPDKAAGQALSLIERLCRRDSAPGPIPNIQEHPQIPPACLP